MLEVEYKDDIKIPLNAAEETSRVYGSLYYTPVITQLASEFSPNGYNVVFNEIYISVVITMYNEDVTELQKTLRGVAENIQYMTKKYNDPNFSRHICVVIVSDGREKANKQTLNELTLLGIFSEKVMNEALGEYGSATIGLHLFQGIVRLPIDLTSSACFPDMNLIFALKEHNRGKIDSHWWFFNAICDNCNPDYCFLLDVGTVPEKKSVLPIVRVYAKR